MRQIIIIFFLFLPFCVLAQLLESFDGPEVDSANPWIADKAHFSIRNGTLLFDGSSLTGDYACYVPVVYAPNMEWQIDVNLSFRSSNTNHARIYVYATEGSGSVLYYLQVGHNDHNVSLYRQKGMAAPQRVINGRKELLGTGASSVKIKLTMEAERTWTLFTSADDVSFRQEGQPFTDSPLQNIRPGGYLNITCRCKAASLKNMVYMFDNVKVLPEITSTPTVPDKEPDEQPGEKPDSATAPTLLYLEEEDEKSLLLTFDKKVDAVKSRFMLNEKEAAAKVYISSDETVLKPVWAGDRESETTYRLTYSGIKAKGGTAECKGNKTFTSRLGSQPDDSGESPGHFVRINEIMADPNGLITLPQTEYVELYNMSGTPCQLGGWDFIYNGKPTTLTDLLLPAGGYVVLHREGRDIQIAPSGQSMPLAKFPALLANNGKTLQLKSPSGELVDEVTYAKAKPGIAWERSTQGLYLSTDPKGGTPGAANSRPENKPEKPDRPDVPDTPEPPADNDDCPVERNDIVINELLPDPYTGGSEYIELYNRSGRKLPVNGLSVATRKSDGTLSTHYSLSSVPFVLEPEGYLLLTKNTEGVSSFYLISSPDVLHQLKLPVLANTSSTVVVFRTDNEEVIDEVTYSSKWHASSVKNTKGVALERVDPDAPTQDAANWTSAAATSGYGTPGYRNSQYGQGNDSHPLSIEIPVYSDTTGEYFIMYYMDKPGYTCRVRIFDVSGRYLADIANHELLGIDGRLLWNGNGRDGSKLPAGIYILHVELAHPEGSAVTCKKVFLVH